MDGHVAGDLGHRQQLLAVSTGFAHFGVPLALCHCGLKPAKFAARARARVPVRANAAQCGGSMGAVVASRDHALGRAAMGAPEPRAAHRCCKPVVANAPRQSQRQVNSSGHYWFGCAGYRAAAEQMSAATHAYLLASYLSVAASSAS